MHTLLFRFSEVTTLRPTAQFTAMFDGCLLGVRSVLSPPPPPPEAFRRSEGAELIDSVLDVVRKEAEGNAARIS